VDVLYRKEPVHHYQSHAPKTLNEHTSLAQPA